MYAVVPGQSVCIDKSLVRFRGRLVFRQYIRNKRHKFGIKLYKLCFEHGYTYKTSIVEKIKLSKMNEHPLK